MTSHSLTSSSSGESWILSIETTGRIGGIALVPRVTAASTSGSGSSAHSTRVDPPAARRLLPAMDELLDRSHVARADLAAVAVTVGPGSFTGCRIGVAAAKSIAYALGVPTIPVNTLDAIAEARPQLAVPRLWIALDAQRGDLFVAKYDLPWKYSRESADPTSLVAKSTWLAELAPEDAVMGPPTLRQELPPQVAFLDFPPAEVVAEAAGRLARESLDGGDTTSPFELVPRYYRESAAEEKRRLA